MTLMRSPSIDSRCDPCWQCQLHVTKAHWQQPQLPLHAVLSHPAAYPGTVAFASLRQQATQMHMVMGNVHL